MCESDDSSFSPLTGSQIRCLAEHIDLSFHQWDNIRYTRFTRSKPMIEKTPQRL